MVKAGIGVAVVVIFISVCGALITPLLVPCGALFAGAIAGYLASIVDNPTLKADTIKKGMGAGLISSAGAVIGQFVGAALNAAIMGPEGMRNLMSQWGMDAGPAAISTPSYWVGVVGGAICMAALSVGLAAALGALGGQVWWSTIGAPRQAAAQPPSARAV